MHNLGAALLYLVQPWPLALVVVGAALGIIVGAIPGLTGAMLIALALPLTFAMDGADAMILLVSMYVGSISGGLISATILRMPGTPASMMTTLDDQLSRILDMLQQTGQRDNTVIIFTSDHGESLGDHGLLEKGCRFYEGLVRVPLIFSWPRKFQSDLQSDSLVELLDKTATIVELAGLEQPEYMQGKSLLPILTGEASPEHHRDFVRSEYFDALDPHFTGGDGTFATMHRTRRHKLSVYHGHDLGELYDLECDPWEFHNLWDDPASQELKHDLLHQSFDAHVLLTTDVGSCRIAPM